jgi:hypothetical protein
MEYDLHYVAKYLWHSDKLQSIENSVAEMSNVKITLHEQEVNAQKDTIKISVPQNSKETEEQEISNERIEFD